MRPHPSKTSTVKFEKLGAAPHKCTEYLVFPANYLLGEHEDAYQGATHKSLRNCIVNNSFVHLLSFLPVPSYQGATPKNLCNV